MSITIPGNLSLFPFKPYFPEKVFFNPEVVPEGIHCPILPIHRVTSLATCFIMKRSLQSSRLCYPAVLAQHPAESPVRGCPGNPFVILTRRVSL